jgi:hypothetical protein
MQATSSSRPNYIHTLQGIQRDAHTLAEQATTEILDLVSYLESPKFHSDPTVQVADVLRRLTPALSTIRDIADVTLSGRRTYGATL